ncbi:MAG: hypothetical protein ACR2P9_07635 [Gammaproteobacteria bacterium]
MNVHLRSTQEKLIIFSALVIFAVSCAFPPWVSIFDLRVGGEGSYGYYSEVPVGYYCICAPPQAFYGDSVEKLYKKHTQGLSILDEKNRSIEIDKERLLLQWAVLFSLAGAGLVALRLVQSKGKST